MSFFEWSARVPLIIHAPQQFARRRVSHNVSLVDLLPTLVDIVSGNGAKPDLVAPVDGQSLVPLLQGEEIDWDTPVYGEYLAEGAIAPCLMIRRGRFKYIFCESDPDQLYDLQTDPLELDNLAGRADYEEIRQTFKADILARWQPTSLKQSVIASQRRRRLVYQALMRGKYTAWDYQPYRNASQQYMRNHLDLNELERTARFPPPGTPASDFVTGK
jgi:choline-sulfatase